MTRTPEAHAARSAVQYALRIGTLTRPDRCQNPDCGKVGKVEAAHEDYSQQLDVKWLCTSCHRKWDRQKPKGGTMETPAPVAQFKDRIKELRRMTASELRANPKNWRTHPAEQSAAMTAVLNEIGIAGALLAYIDEEGRVTLIDGHLRQELITDQPIPVLILDVTEAEAVVLLATYDPLSALASTDNTKLIELLEQAQPDSAILQGMLDRMGQEAADELVEAAAQASEPENADGEVQAGGTSTMADEESGYTTFTAPLTLGQEQTVRQALRLARGKYGLEKTGEALARLCEQWLQDNPQAS
jgi:hypothetical protein